ncbi:MAG: DUF1330 domain-containing protein [Candidatus Dormibacterales bacterium]
MAAYVIGNIEVTDLEGYQSYSRRVAPIVAEYGGRFLVRGSPPEVLDGDWQPNRVVVLEFPDAEAVRRWHGSPEYQAIIGIRHQNSKGGIALFEGA